MKGEEKIWLMRVLENCDFVKLLMEIVIIFFLASVTLVKMILAFYRDPKRIPVLFLEF